MIAIDQLAHRGRPPARTRFASSQGRLVARYEAALATQQNRLREAPRFAVTEGGLRGRKTGAARLTVISGDQARARGRAILKVARAQPITSHGSLTFECGNCGAVVLEYVEVKQVRNCVVECYCGTFNEVAR